MRHVGLIALALFTLAMPAAAARAPINAAQDLWPVWSPSGKDIAFTRSNGTGRIFTLEVLHLATHEVTAVGASAGQLHPTWSPDGTQLAYASGGILYVANADGTGKHRYVAPTKAFAPAWRPGSTQLAYLTTKGSTNTDLWVGDEQWAPNAVGAPAWSPDGTTLAFQRDDGIYRATGRESQRLLFAARAPGAPAWSHDGTRVAFMLGEGFYVVAIATGHVTQFGRANLDANAPAFSPDDSQVRVDVAWSAKPGVFVGSGPRPGCPGHTVLVWSNTGKALTGNCAILGTAGADVIYGTSTWGDVISGGAGNDQIHANDGHTDRVDCGPGRDTVWADRTDRLTRCEVIHR